jgi:hypothetical protein
VDYCGPAVGCVFVGLAPALVGLVCLYPSMDFHCFVELPLIKGLQSKIFSIDRYGFLLVLISPGGKVNRGSQFNCTLSLLRSTGRYRL